MRTIGLLVGLLLLLPAMMLSAQDDACPVDVAAVVAEAAEACADLGEDEICFGHAPVNTIINCDDSLEFDETGDMVAANLVCALRLGALNAEGEWGLAKARVNVTDSDSLLELVMFGDLESQNAASSLSEREVWVESDTQLRRGPASNFEVIMDIAAGQSLRANACNCTANWLRIVMDDGVVGWIPTNRVSIVGGDTDDLPMVTMDTPVYETMQALTLHTGTESPACDSAPANGMMLQVETEGETMQVEINGVAITLDSTVLLSAADSADLTVTVLDGTATVEHELQTFTLIAGSQVMVPLNESGFPAIDDVGHVGLMSEDTIANLPLAMLSREIDPATALDLPTPQIVGSEYCEIISNMGGQSCPLHFINRDGDAIVIMDVVFVDAPIGEWEGSIHEEATLLTGDASSGTLAWESSCSLGSENFIGPVEWDITLTDENGHMSEPYRVAFQCVDG